MVNTGQEQVHQGLPVPGYQPQPEWKVKLVKELKEAEERLLRKIDAMRGSPEIDLDLRWAQIAFTKFQEGFMALNRSVFKPTRISLPEDTQTGA